MRKYVGLSIGIVFLLTSCVYTSQSTQDEQEKIYVAVEGENRIAVLNPVTQTLIKAIDLSEQVENKTHEFSPHNVQVAPDGKSVWVTANHGHGDVHEEEREHDKEDAHNENIEEAPDQVIVIDPSTDAIIKRIPIDLGVHLAHIVVAKDGSFAYATAQAKGSIYKIDAKEFEIAEMIEAPKGSEPHGLRLSPDGTAAYIALLQGKALGMLDLQTNNLTVVPLAGNAVQTGITPDGKFVVISLYDTKQLAVFDVATKNVSYIDLPEGAKGPIQMYPTPDGRFMYLADQGYYFEQPMGNSIFKIDLFRKSVTNEIPAGDAPHGVVSSPDGKFVYVTNLLTNDVSIIDTATDAEVGRVGVGKMPNGISIWSRSSGGTP